VRPAPSPSTPEGEPSAPTTVDDVPSGNPLGDYLPFSLSLPTIEVRMVNAAGLEDYEIWFAFSSALAASVVGFAVAYMQSFHTTSQGIEESQPIFAVVAVIFAMLFVASALRAGFLRGRLKRETRTYAMRAVSSPVPEKE
jgi:hypothetical protein